MKKGVLIFCISLQTLLCAAQDDGTAGTTVKDIHSGDSVSFITDLVSLVRENSKVLLSWKKLNGNRSDFITVERSSGGRDFEVVAVLKQSESGPDYEWTDDSPAKGRNLYRVRFTAKNGQPAYSGVVTAQIAGDISFRFYPNPVDNILIIRSESPLDVQITDANGKVRVSQNRLQGLQTINVSTLEKGLYLLRINNRTSGTIIQEKLLKN
jgi:hypothetical protein